jgi:hypothetical protein
MGCFGAVGPNAKGLAMLFERKWPSVLLVNISVANAVITVSSTIGLHPKQEITLRNAGLNPLELEVKRIISKTQLQVGLRKSNISKYENPVSYTGGTLEAVEQERNVIDANAGIRAAYAEEPTVALRTTLVDYFGESLATSQTQTGETVLKVDANTVSDLIPEVDYDGIYPSFATLTDTWTYRKGATVVRTILITYTGPDKKTIAPYPLGVRYL